jgi:hypothetical protein
MLLHLSSFWCPGKAIAIEPTNSQIALQGLLYTFTAVTDTSSQSAPSTQERGAHATAAAAAAAALRTGKSIIIDTDTAGARALRAAQLPGVYVFILPESGAALRKNCEAELRGGSGAEVAAAGWLITNCDSGV